jgi:hypothetical protein
MPCEPNITEHQAGGTQVVYLVRDDAGAVLCSVQADWDEITHDGVHAAIHQLWAAFMAARGRVSRSSGWLAANRETPTQPQRHAHLRLLRDG